MPSKGAELLPSGHIPQFQLALIVVSAARQDKTAVGRNRHRIDERSMPSDAAQSQKLKRFFPPVFGSAEGAQRLARCHIPQIHGLEIPREEGLAIGRKKY